MERQNNGWNCLIRTFVSYTRLTAWCCSFLMVVRLIKKFLLARSPSICYRFPAVRRNCSAPHTLTSYTVGDIIFHLRLGLPRGLILEATLSYFVKTWSPLSVCITCSAHRTHTWLCTKLRVRFATTCKPNLYLRLVIFRSFAISFSPLSICVFLSVRCGLCQLVYYYYYYYYYY